MLIKISFREICGEVDIWSTYSQLRKANKNESSDDFLKVNKAQNGASKRNRLA